MTNAFKKDCMNIFCTINCPKTRREVCGTDMQTYGTFITDLLFFSLPDVSKCMSSGTSSILFAWKNWFEACQRWSLPLHRTMFPESEFQLVNQLVSLFSALVSSFPYVVPITSHTTTSVSSMRPYHVEWRMLIWKSSTTERVSNNTKYSLFALPYYAE